MLTLTQGLSSHAWYPPAVLHLPPQLERASPSVLASLLEREVLPLVYVEYVPCEVAVLMELSLRARSSAPLAWWFHAGIAAQAASEGLSLQTLHPLGSWRRAEAAAVAVGAG